MIKKNMIKRKKEKKKNKISNPIKKCGNKPKKKNN